MQPSYVSRSGEAPPPKGTADEVTPQRLMIDGRDMREKETKRFVALLVLFAVEKGTHECGERVERVVKGGTWLHGVSCFALISARRRLRDSHAHAV